MQGECYLAAGNRGPPWHGSMGICEPHRPLKGEYIKDRIVRIFQAFSNNINPTIAQLDPSQFPWSQDNLIEITRYQQPTPQ
jgi:hypothetical protein